MIVRNYPGHRTGHAHGSGGRKTYLARSRATKDAKLSLLLRAYQSFSELGCYGRNLDQI